MKQIFPGVWKEGRTLFTKSLVPTKKEFTRTVIKGKTEYREWDHRRSKAAAAIMNGLKEFHIKKGSKIHHALALQQVFFLT